MKKYAAYTLVFLGLAALAYAGYVGHSGRFIDMGRPVFDQIFVNYNIAIGKSEANAELDVDGKIRAREICDQAGANCKVISEGWQAGSPNSLDAADGSPARAVYVDNEGRVGIGTLTPASALHVVGDLRATGVANCESLATDSTGKLQCGTGSIWGLSGTTAYREQGAVAIGATAASSGLSLDVEGRIGAAEYCDETGLDCRKIADIGRIDILLRNCTGHVSCTAYCPIGYTATGGGCELNGDDLRSMRPTHTLDGYHCKRVYGTIYGYAICMKSS